MLKRVLWIAFILTFSVFITGCSSSTKDKEAADKATIKIGYNNFSETIAEVNIWKLILEDQGYQVELIQTEKGPLFTSLAEGDLDVNVEVWLPHTDKPYVDKYHDSIVQHKSWYEDTTLGLAVPKYVDIDSIEELNEHKEAFHNQIIGIEPGSSIMGLTEEVIDEYDLDFKLVESSDAAMSAELKKSYEAEDPIVTTLWQPHWAFARWDLKFLDDPKNVYGDPDKMYWFSREGFEEDYPEVTKWFDQWNMTHEQLSDLMNVMEEYDKNPEKGAKKWIDDNQDLVDKWIK
ncbi:glycine betaine ABC transporter substrate-binding protein [Lentibacillus sp. N15]|uniref:glycine betaine ABC transporter substrate-binding protein n=1 Tax=Lentibacillus songyuanensis TaxID=3136161 RepID=UPI0031B9DAE9